MLPRRGTFPVEDSPGRKSHHDSEYKRLNSKNTHILICVISKTFFLLSKSGNSALTPAEVNM